MGGDRCAPATAHPNVVAALTQIERSIDPCGQSEQLSYLLARFRECAQNGYPICVNRRSDRNSIDRSSEADGQRVVITWNPDLRNELELGCAGDSARPVLRDPTASLLHEVTHAVQDCDGLDPTQHELEAVRMENIYRRAHGLCQRSAYGSEQLPAHMLLACEPGNCRCAPGAEPPGYRLAQPAVTDGETAAGDDTSAVAP
jgi:hypothetical protein